MEQEGFSVNLEVLEELRGKYLGELQELTTQIYEAAGSEFNINSNQQLAKVLFEDLGLKHGKKTKTGYSVAAEVLQELSHPIIPLLMRYRKIAKLQSTYLSGILTQVDKHTHKVHTVFRQCLTTTGRLSSIEPNLQNIPIRTDEGREIRKMFCASEGRVLVTADYSQIELRLLAHFSGDETLKDAYQQNLDIHSITASKIFGVPLEQVTSTMRRDAKAVNFGIVYGMSAFGLSNSIGTSIYKAQQFQDTYFDTYKRVKAYMASNIETATREGKIATMFGRIRHFPELRSPNYNTKSFGERAAINMPLQGTASDIIKIAMLRVASALNEKNLKSKLILQVHDELLIDTYLNEVDEVKDLLKTCMESAATLTVPLVAEVKMGQNWLEVE